MLISYHISLLHSGCILHNICHSKCPAYFIFFITNTSCLVCHMLNAYPSPGGPLPQKQPSVSVHNWRRRPCWLNVRNRYVLSPQTTTNQISAFPPNLPLYPRVIMRAWCFLVILDKDSTLSHTPSTAEICAWHYQQPPLSSCGCRRVQRMDVFPG